MADSLLYNCPLCCNCTFDSKQSLLDHLTHIISLNIVCPICNQDISSLEELTEHLKIDNCEVTNNDQNIDIEADLCAIVKVENDNNTDPHHLSHSSNELITQESIQNEIPVDSIQLDNGTDEKIYVELLRKQLTKPCLQTQELKLVKEGGQSRYLILTDEESHSIMNPNVTVVTKQNIDGTISLTTMKDTQSSPNKEPEMEPEPSISDDDKSSEEIYSCNTCGVSFSSVLEHIQNYHNDEDVVVHEPVGDNGHIPIKYANPLEEEMEVDKQASRRMITEAGDIIETPFMEDKMCETEYKTVVIPAPEEEMSTANQVGRPAKVNATPKTKLESKSKVYHKVVIKEVQTTSGNRVKVFNCTTCNIYVSSLADFKDQPCKILNYQCPHCPVAYVNSKSLCAHMKVHKIRTTDIGTAINLTKFECEICNTQFPSSKSLKLHKKMHDPIKSRPIDPPVETPEGMPASDDKYLCGVCDKLIPIDYRLIHQNSHKTSNKLNCGICNKKFPDREYLEMHMSVHKLDKVIVENNDKTLPYNCLYCSRKFARPHEKVKHERIHTGEKPHSCEICGKSFRVSYCLTLHMRTHTGARPYACPHCNKRFKAHSVYNHHMLTHSDVRAYKCPFCPKAFKTSVQLAGHKNSHTKPFSCQQCNRPFASLYAVRVHMENHTRQNSLKFSCTLCGASYARAFALKDHMKQAHKQDVDSADNLATDSLEKDWLVQENTEMEADEIQLNRDLPQDMNELDLRSGEMIIQ